METETRKVTTEALRKIEMGETVRFEMPKLEPQRSRAIQSGKSLAYRLQREFGCKFTASADFDNACLTITKLPQP